MLPWDPYEGGTRVHFILEMSRVLLIGTPLPTSDSSTRRGLNGFADELNLPLQLYTPFWDDLYHTPYNMTWRGKCLPISDNRIG